MNGVIHIQVILGSTDSPVHREDTVRSKVWLLLDCLAQVGDLFLQLWCNQGHWEKYFQSRQGHRQVQRRDTCGCSFSAISSLSKDIV